MNIEDYRRAVLRSVRSRLPLYREEAARILGRPVLRAEPTGSVLDPFRFGERSDVDLAICVTARPGEPTGLDPDASEALLGRLWDGLGGALDVLVFRVAAGGRRPGGRSFS